MRALILVSAAALALAACESDGNDFNQGGTGTPPAPKAFVVGNEAYVVKECGDTHQGERVTIHALPVGDQISVSKYGNPAFNMPVACLYPIT